MEMEMKVECACKKVFNIKLGRDGGNNEQTNKLYSHDCLEQEI